MSNGWPEQLNEALEGADEVSLLRTVVYGLVEIADMLEKILKELENR
jgi:hypothetical protein